MPKRLAALCLALLLASPARADYLEAVKDVLTPGYAAFAQAASDLALAAGQSCDREDLAPAWNRAFDAWLAVSPLRLGPVEQQGRSLAIAYWPDPKGLGAKAQRSLLGAPASELEPDRFAEHSVAARGLTGLERLLWPASPPEADPCPLIRATADDLARMAQDIQREWTEGYAQVMLTAGEPGNTTFLTRAEVRQALFTQIDAALDFDIAQRLGRPLGTFDKPRPELAESRASGRSLRNVLVSLQALRRLCDSLSPDLPLTMAAFDNAIATAESLDDPVFDGVATPGGRLKVEILQQSVQSLRDTVRQELARELDVDLGFNAADGD